MENIIHLNNLISFANTKFASIKNNSNIINVSVEQIKNGFLKQINSLNSIELYETYKTENIFIRPYFDIDVKLKTSENINKQADDILDLAKYKIIEFFNCDENDLAILSDHRDDKISYHINIINQFTTMNELLEWSKDYLSELLIDSFDPNIYHTGETKWRTIYSSKVKDNKPLSNGLIKVSNHNDLDFIVSYTLQNMKRWVYKSKNLKIKINNSKSNNQICKIKQDKFLDYLKCINKNRFEQYNNWFKLACIFKNIGISYNIFNDYCKDIKGYCNEKNVEIFENIDTNNSKTAKWGALYNMAEEDNITLKDELDLKYTSSKEFNFNIFNSIKNKISKLFNDKLASINSLIELSDSKTDIKRYTKEKNDIQNNYENELYKKQKQYFEKFHFVTTEPTLIVKINIDGLYYYSYKQVLDTYGCLGENFIKKWKLDPFVRRYKKIDFLPPPKNSNKDIYNLYNDIPILSHELVDNDIDIFINHCYYLSGKNEKAKEYLLNYLAHLVQKPGILPGVALIFKSVQGIGKSLFFYKLFTNIFGINKILSTANSGDLFDRFNRLGGKIVSILDETSGKDSFSKNEIIKNIITSETVKVENKGKDAYDVNNYCRFLFFTNNDTPIKIEMSDRRFMVFECSDEVKKIENYFKNLSNSLDDMSKIKGFYNFLLKRDIESINLEKDRVITDSYLDIQSVNIPIIIRFIKYYVCQYIMPDNLIELELEEHEYSNPIKDIQNKKEKISVSKFYDIFKKWNTDYNYNSKYNITQFGREITKYINKNIGITKIKNSSIYYNFDFNLLTKYFIDNPLI